MLQLLLCAKYCVLFILLFILNVETKWWDCGADGGWDSAADGGAVVLMVGLWC